MLTVILEYLPTVIIALVLIGIVAAIIAGMVRDKKKGKSCGCGCGCSGCSGCPMSESCKKDNCEQ